MVNNFDKFKREWRDNEFYFIQIIKRKKDNPDVVWINWNNHARCIKEYSIYSQEQLDKHKEEMIKIAEATNSRIYIHPAKRNKDEIAKDLCLLIWEHIAKWWHWSSWLYRHACWLNAWTEKLWIVDLDDDRKDFYTFQSMRQIINNLRPWWDKIVMELPTVNWFHFITKPFDLQRFKEIFPNIDVHKNNPTILYYNNIDVE